jgi:hypothetical protein
MKQLTSSPITEANFRNRYGNNIMFRHEGDKVTMIGFEPMGLRVACPNMYENAYKAYCDKTDNPISMEQFQKDVHEYKHDQPEWVNPLTEYRPLVTPDQSRFVMVDPSGGPYIGVGQDLKDYFQDGINRIVEKIEFPNDGSIEFTIRSNG